MDDNIANLFKRGKEKAHENWRAELPDFKFKDGQARQAWEKHLASCKDDHSREAARYAANLAHAFDTFFTYEGTQKSPTDDFFSNVADTHHGFIRVPGVTSERSIKDAMQLLKEISI